MLSHKYVKDIMQWSDAFIYTGNNYECGVECRMMQGSWLKYLRVTGEVIFPKCKQPLINFKQIKNYHLI